MSVRKENEFMSKYPLISAVITTRNRVELLKKAIIGVKSQTYGNIECIVVDDASTDGTCSYCKTLSDIIYIRIGPGESRGGNYARNIGVKEAKGDFIAFCDDDDIWLPQKIELQYNIISRNLDIGLIYCGRKNICIVGKDKYMIDILPDKRNKGDISRKIMYAIPCLTSTIMVRSFVLKDVGLFDENMGFWQEYELLIRIAQKTKFDFVDQCLVYYLCDENSKTRLTNKYYEWLSTVRYVHVKHKELYERMSLFEKIMYKFMVVSERKNRSKRAGVEGLKYKRIISCYYLSFVIVFPFLFFRKIQKYYV